MPTYIKFRNAAFVCSDPTDIQIQSVSGSEIDYKIFWNSEGDLYQSYGNTVEWKISYSIDGSNIYNQITGVSFPNDNMLGTIVSTVPHVTIDFKIEFTVLDSQSNVLCSKEFDIYDSQIVII